MTKRPTEHEESMQSVSGPVLGGATGRPPTAEEVLMRPGHAGDQAPQRGKNIVVCCDGTRNQFGWTHTNVVKLCWTLVRDPGRQIVFYDPGVGTMGDQRMVTRFGKWLTRLLGGAIGLGLGENTEEAYDFLARNYEEGDRIFLFGFSRGAYTVRALAGMIHMYGLTARDTGNLTPYVWKMYRQGRSEAESEGGRRFAIAKEFRETFGTPVPVHFVGVWDTVSSVGWFWDPLHLPFTRKNSSVRHGRHAVAIDERRAFFRQNLWSKSREGQDLKEVWFAGVHGDIGGGYAEDESGLSKVTLDWLIREAIGLGLIVDEGRLKRMLGGEARFAAPDALAEPHNSMNVGWAILEFLPRIRWRANGKHRFIGMNLFRRRSMPEKAKIHDSVVKRMSESSYDPANLPVDHEVVSTASEGSPDRRRTSTVP